MFVKSANIRNSRSGFTLIELLAVVAIIGTLSAIALPQLQEYRQRGYDTAALQNIDNFKIAVMDDNYQYSGGNFASITNGPHPKFAEVMIGENVLVESGEYTNNGVQGFYAYSCNTRGNVNSGYMIVVPYTSGDIGAATTNVVIKSPVYRILAGCV